MEIEDVRVKVCQQELIKLDLQIKAIVQDINQCNGSADSLKILNVNVKERITEFNKHILELQKLAKEQDKETDTIILTKDAEHHKKELQSNLSLLRKANLQCQLQINNREKEELLSNGTQTRQRLKSKKDSVARTSADVTNNLMSLTKLMAGQVKQSEQNMETLVSSSHKITETQEEFKNMTGHIHSSRKLLTKYGRREFTDKLLIILALIFFFASVLYIVKKRLFS